MDNEKKIDSKVPQNRSKWHLFEVLGVLIIIISLTVLFLAP